MTGKAKEEISLNSIDQQMFSVIHFDPVIKNQSANVELPISMNFKVQVTETIYYTVLNYV